MSGFWKKSEKVQQLVLSHLSHVQQAMTLFAEATRAYFLRKDRNEAERLMLETHEAESEADDVRRTVERTMIEGALLATSRRQLLQIVDRVDTLANAAQATLHSLLGQSIQIPEEIVPRILSILSETEALFGDVSCGIESLLSGRHADAMASAQRIDEHESVIDRLESETVKMLFSLGIDLARKLHALRYIEALVEISDRAEDLADQVSLVAAERAF
jgi:predicted phosphate transport protein (TIGR00153 family)